MRSLSSCLQTGLGLPCRAHTCECISVCAVNVCTPVFLLCCMIC